MSTEYSRMTDHVRRAIFSLNPVFWGKPRIATITRIFAEEIQELEDAAWSVIHYGNVDNAFRHKLVELGKLVGQPEDGFDTEVLRALVKTRALINRSRGRADDLILVAKALVSASSSAVVRWYVSAPHTSTVLVDQAGDVPARATRAVLGAAKRGIETLHYYHSGEQGLRPSSTTGLAAGFGVLGHSSNPNLGTPCFSAGYAGNKKA